MSKSAKYHSPLAPHPWVKSVPKADGKGWKTPTILDAIKLGLMPGVTTTLDVAKDGLATWQTNQAIFHCAILPYHGRFDGETHDGHPDHKINQADFKEYQKEIEGRMKDVLETFADDGSDVDAQLRNAVMGKPYTLGNSVDPALTALRVHADELGVDRIVSGLRLASKTLWCTGEPDLYGFKDGKLRAVWDLKRKNSGTYKRCMTKKGPSEKGLDENHRLQLGHYLVMLKEYEDAHPDGVVLGILMSCRDDDNAMVIPIQDTEQWEQAAIHHNASWFLRKGWTKPTEIDETTIREIEEYNKWQP